MATIGLFPLNIVLFPGSSYPLHIFESKYKVLVGEAVASGTEFGINLVEHGRMYQTGCLARVSGVRQVYDDGRMDIVVTGTSRYVVRAYGTDEKPYITADAEFFEDDEPIPDREMLQKTITLYNKLVEAVYGAAEELLDPGQWGQGGASFRIAQKAGLQLNIRQQLLEMRSETERLISLLKYLNEVLPKIKQVEAFQMITRNDGYVKPG
jgi:Lon protease-like protein